MSRSQQCLFCGVDDGGVHERHCPNNPMNQRATSGLSEPSAELDALRQRVGELAEGLHQLRIADLSGLKAQSDGAAYSLAAALVVADTVTDEEIETLPPARRRGAGSPIIEKL